MVPLKNRKPYVFVEGMPDPKPQQSVPGELCPKCHPDEKAEALVEVEVQRLKTHGDFHKSWERKCNRPFVYVETRHGSFHTLLDARESLKIGNAIEALCTHLQKLTGSLELTLTRPDNYNLFVLWERASWDGFRATLEKHLTPEQLGPNFAIAREMHGYDVWETPHFYETPLTARTRPPVHGALSFFGRRQIVTATQNCPVWLSEGFAAYSEYVVLRNVRWYSIYDANNPPELGDSLAVIRRLANAGKLRRFEKFLPRQLSEYEPADYPQAFSLVYYLLNKAPAKFLDFARLLRGGASGAEALEDGLDTKLATLEGEWGKWALNAR